MAKTHKAEGKRMAREAASDKFAKFTTSDSFQNFLARLGVGTENLSTASSYGFNPISRVRTQLEWMYRGSWIVGQVCDTIAADMTREGVEIGAGMQPDDIDVIQNDMRELDIWGGIDDTIKWARLYGGALAFMMIDGQDPKTPLRTDSIKEGQFKGLLPMDRWLVQPSYNKLIKEMGPDYGMPEFYQIIAGAPGMPSNLTMHHSRVLRFEGAKIPYWQRLAENLWNMSVIERLYDRLIAFDSTSQGAAQLVYKAHLRVYKVEKLREIIAAGGPAYQALLKQIELIRLMQTNEGLTTLDSTDDFISNDYTFSGLDQVLLMFGEQLSGATGIPLVRLFGQSPAGLNSTGENDIRNYYDNIKQQQERSMRRNISRLMHVMSRSSLGKPLDKGFNYEFAPLWQLKDEEKADTAQKITATVQTALEGGLVVKRSTALNELRQSSRITGVWSNISDEDIQDAENEPPVISETEQPDKPDLRIVT